MRVIDGTDRAALARLLNRDAARDVDVMRQAARIVNDVRRRGDSAIRAWRRRLGEAAGPIEVSGREIRRGWRDAPFDVRRAIRVAIANVRDVAERQRPRGFVAHVSAGVRVEQRVEPLGRVGCYVPAGRFPLPSTLVMTATPAIVAGVKDVVVACPNPTPAILCAALECGVARVFRIGGAQAMAALAYGTQTVPPVDKIVGPGSAWVAAAKQIVSRDVAVDAHAGPSELVLWADAGRVDWIAADLVAQAEHDIDTRAVFLTTSRPLALGVATRVHALTAPTSIARRALARNGAAVVVSSRRAALAFVNAFAPEHLVCTSRRDALACRTAGTIFVGPWSAPAAGDYTTGSNHVLPTGGQARVRSGLSTADFVRTFSIQTVTAPGLRRIGPAAIALATAEGLVGHADSIRRRVEVEP